MARWPEWWGWELDLSPHVLKRMLDRDFSEVDLRLMMEQATALLSADEPEHWIVQTRHGSQPWHVIIEPDAVDRLLVVVTAYPVDKL